MTPNWTSVSTKCTASEQCPFPRTQLRLSLFHVSFFVAFGKTVKSFSFLSIHYEVLMEVMFKGWIQTAQESEWEWHGLFLYQLVDEVASCLVSPGSNSHSTPVYTPCYSRIHLFCINLNRLMRMYEIALKKSTFTVSFYKLPTELLCPPLIRLSC